MEILDNIGIRKIKTNLYLKHEDQIYEDTFMLAFVRAFTYLLLSTQIIIYSSNDFKSFYLKFILETNKEIYKKAIFNSFLYNNRLIKKMNSSIEKRKEIDEFLLKLENQIHDWSNSNIIKKNSLNGNKNNNNYGDNNPNNPNNPFKVKEEEKKINCKENENEKEKENVISIDKYNNIIENIIEEKEVENENENENKKENQNIKTQIKTKTKEKEKEKDKNENENENYNIDYNDVKDKLVNSYSNIFDRHNKIKKYFYKKIKEIFWLNLINVFSKNTTNYIFMSKDRIKKYEQSIFKGKIYSESILEEKIKEEIEKINFNGITEQDIDIILNNIFKAKEMIKKKMSKKKKSKNSKNHKSKFPSKEKEKEYKDLNNAKDIIQELSEEDDLSNFSSEDFYDITKDLTKIENVSLYKYHMLLNNKIFDKYYTNWKIFSFLFYHFIECLLDNFQFICFFLMIMNNFINASVISLFWPIFVFTIGIISNPRPSNIFWKISMIYCSVVIMLKYSLQIRIENKALFPYFETDKYRLGLKCLKDFSYMKFINYILWDCILLLTLLIQQYILITNGLWKKTESEIEDIKEGYERIFKAENAKNENELNITAGKICQMHVKKMEKKDNEKILKKKKDSKNTNNNNIANTNINDEANILKEKDSKERSKIKMSNKKEKELNEIYGKENWEKEKKRLMVNKSNSTSNILTRNKLNPNTNIDSDILNSNLNNFNINFSKSKSISDIDTINNNNKFLNENNLNENANTNINKNIESNINININNTKKKNHKKYVTSGDIVNFNPNLINNTNNSELKRKNTFMRKKSIINDKLNFQSANTNKENSNSEKNNIEKKEEKSNIFKKFFFDNFPTIRVNIKFI
jgi:hypothetical protein